MSRLRFSIRRRRLLHWWLLRLLLLGLPNLIWALLIGIADAFYAASDVLQAGIAWLDRLIPLPETVDVTRLPEEP